MNHVHPRGLRGNPVRVLKRLARKIVPRQAPAPALRGEEFFAQQGEDIILNCLFQGRREGFYVDVGAHHPWRFSNTYYFYRKGWRGINIEAMPGAMEVFRAERPRDINLEQAIAADRRTLTYYMFDEPAVNGFSAELSQSRDGQGAFKIVGERPIETRTLSEVLEAHLPPGQPIDFLSVDVEGLDLDVLRSNDWQRFRPSVVLAEELDHFLIGGLDDSRVVRLMRDLGYRPCSKAVHTLIFVAEERLTVGPDGGATIARGES